MGHNLGLGHRIGIMADDSELRPRQVSPESLVVDVDENSDTQLDIRWAAPQNRSKFTNLLYDVEARLVQSQSWENINSVYHTVFRIYHTEDKLFVGRLHISRREQDVEVILRVRARGQQVSEQGEKHELVGEWSQHIVVTFLGTKTLKHMAKEVQMTNL